MKSQICRVALIGVGSIGKRHLESLIKLKHKSDILLIDRNLESLKFCKNTNKNISTHNFFYSTQLKDLPKNIDLAIISTNSDVRREVTEQLINYTQVKYIIFEKIVFQSIKDFQKIIKSLEKKKIKSWVNCPRRISTIYKKIKKQVNNKTIKINVEGNDWGMASNSVHYLDLFLFLTGENKFTLIGSNLDRKIYKSKRKTFLEFGGKFMIKTLKGSIIKIQDTMRGKNWPKISIETKNKKIDINQQDGIIKLFNKNTMSLIKQKKFNLPLQNDLTHKCVNQIINHGESELPSIRDSYLIHRLLIKLFNKHLLYVKKKNFLRCPIT